ncbi:MAG: hypothetical protein PHD95_02125 [Candidatus ainarchaeum sp.]|nr:hypothetical protein [Candidatus ainarchaeum sp.]
MNKPFCCAKSLVANQKVCDAPQSRALQRGKKAAQKAFVFSLEAALSLILLSGFLLMQMPQEKKDLHELLVFQKENDLLKIWAKQQKFAPEEMQKDFEFAFPKAGGEIFLDGKILQIGNKTQKAIASEIYFFSSEGGETRISIKVFE